MIKSLGFILVAIFISSLLLTDAYLIPGKEKSVIIVREVTKHTVLRNANYYNYFIITSDDCKYEVKLNLYRNLSFGDTIKIITSRILGMPIGLKYLRSNQVSHYQIGQLNTYKAIKYAIIFCLVISIPLFFMQYGKPLKLFGVMFAIQIVIFVTTILLFLTVMAEAIFISHSS